jgi:hypothetical protein
VVDETAASPSVTTVASPPPAPYEPTVAPAAPCGGPGAYEHDGFYLRLDTGLSGLRLSGSGPTSASPSISGAASVGRIAIGGTPVRGFVVGGVIEGQSTSGSLSAQPAGAPSNGWGASTGTLGAFVDWFPDAHRGWHVGAQLGLTGVSVGNDAAQISWTGGAVSGELLGGYDFWLGPQWSLGIEGLLGLTSRATMEDSNQHDVGYRFSGAAFGLAASLLYH